MYPDIEQFLKTLRREPAAYIPLAELGIHPIIKEQIIGGPLNTLRDEIEFWRNAGYDYVKLQPSADFTPGIVKNDNHSDSPDRISNRNWASEGKGLITTRQDFEQFRFPAVNDFDYRRFEEARLLLPDGMGVVGQYGDIFTMTWEMMGFETFSFALFEQPELVRALNDKLGGLVLSMFEWMAQCDDVDALWYSDDIAYTNALMVAPQILDELFFPWLKKIGDLAKQHNKPLIYHTDGILYEVFDRIIECGVSAIHPIEPKAMDLGEVKQKYGDRLCLIGNIDVDLLARGTEEEIRKAAREAIIKGGGIGHCFGSGNSIPDYVPLKNYLAMNDEVLKLRE
jgi:uroporphyrinogen decarboxylase